MQEFFIALLKIVSLELVGILGIFFLLGFILAKLKHYTIAQYIDTIGWKGIYITAWFGTPVHELGHLFFAKLFRHNIVGVQFFKPNKETGGLGHVDHSYDSGSLFHNIGNFFIGAAPMIFGGIILFVLLHVLVPNAKDVFAPLNQDHTSVFSVLLATGKALLTLFSVENIQNPLFWVFLYFSFCVSSHIAPSKQDRRGMWKGLLWIVILLVLLNIVPLLLGFNVTQYVFRIYSSMSIIIAIFLYALCISFAHFLLAYGIFYIPKHLKKKFRTQ